MNRQALPPPKDPSEPPEDEVEASRAPLMDHLVELRTRLVRILIAIGVLFGAAWFVTQPVIEFLLVPFVEVAERRGHEAPELVFNAPLELLFIKLKLCFLLALAAGFPYIAFQVYGFVAPGLYKKERAAVLPYLFLMPLLFLAGAALVYYSVLPLFMDITFAQEFRSERVSMSYLGQVKGYYDLAISLLTAFGLSFQLPIVISLLARTGIVEASGLRKVRRYAYVVIFIVAAIMTPSDPFSVWLLSIPLCLLYESGILAAAVIEKGRKKREAEEGKEG